MSPDICICIGLGFSNTALMWICRFGMFNHLVYSCCLQFSLNIWKVPKEITNVYF